MKSLRTHKRLIVETAVAAGLELSGMQLDPRCITASTSRPTPVTWMIPTRFKGT